MPMCRFIMSWRLAFPLFPPLPPAAPTLPPPPAFCPVHLQGVQKLVRCLTTVISRMCFHSSTQTIHTNSTQKICRSAFSLRLSHFISRLSLSRKRAVWQTPRTHHVSHCVHLQVHTRRTLWRAHARAHVHADCSTYRRYHPNAS